MFLRRNDTPPSATGARDHNDLVLWTLRRQADALEGMLRLLRQQMGLTAEESLDVPWTPEAEPTGPPEDPNDAEVWISHSSDEYSAQLEAEAEAAARKRRPR